MLITRLLWPPFKKKRIVATLVVSLRYATSLHLDNEDIPVGFSESVVSNLHKLSAKHLSHFAVRTTTHSITDAVLWRRITKSLILKVNDMDGKDCLRCLTALQDEQLTDLMPLLAIKVTKIASKLPCSDLADLAVCFSQQYCRHAPLYASLSVAFGFKVMSATRIDLCKVALAFARVRIADIDFFNKIATSAILVMSVFDVDQLSALLMSFAVLNICHEQLFFKAEQTLMTQVARLSSQNMYQIAFAYSRSGLIFPRIVTYIQSSLSQVNRLSNIERAELIVSAASLQIHDLNGTLGEIAANLDFDELSFYLFSQVTRAIGVLSLSQARVWHLVIRNFINRLTHLNIENWRHSEIDILLDTKTNEAFDKNSQQTNLADTLLVPFIESNRKSIMGSSSANKTSFKWNHHSSNQGGMDRSFFTPSVISVIDFLEGISFACATNNGLLVWLTTCDSLPFSECLNILITLVDCVVKILPTDELLRACRGLRSILSLVEESPTTRRLLDGIQNRLHSWANDHFKNTEADQMLSLCYSLVLMLSTNLEINKTDILILPKLQKCEDVIDKILNRSDSVRGTRYGWLLELSFSHLCAQMKRLDPATQPAISSNLDGEIQRVLAVLIEVAYPHLLVWSPPRQQLAEPFILNEHLAENSDLLLTSPPKSLTESGRYVVPPTACVQSLSKELTKLNISHQVNVIENGVLLHAVEEDNSVAYVFLPSSEILLPLLPSYSNSPQSNPISFIGYPIAIQLRCLQASGWTVIVISDVVWRSCQAPEDRLAILSRAREQV
eukprot:GHVL01025272.1.p1 GENE.GHVL01025272.1~~GHVL01025272.1.p1  ORF type:complete len:784 (+),score=53.08 GHVL01025272.1:38-2389(+)